MKDYTFFEKQLGRHGQVSNFYPKVQGIMFILRKPHLVARLRPSVENSLPTRITIPVGPPGRQRAFLEVDRDPKVDKE